ncbi:hypothetical protein F7725_026760 [Dissostichus mawsoni]|uniref:WHEP-TRS domain-containing protein n=1 Tax=Dissostichus mawsoni TaxID=36200 RepID=A0A7J5X803_DISMA|nr:hypothetical protein F7725_026760 [Dissostichus mawsoni]
MTNVSQLLNCCWLSIRIRIVLIDQVDAAVKQLLVLKAEYKEATGQDYKPGAAPVQKASAPVQKAPTPVQSSSAPAASGLYEKVSEQGEVVRKLKVEKASKDQVDAAVKQLLVLKAEYKEATGQDYKPGAAPVQKASAPVQKAPPQSRAALLLLPPASMRRSLSREKWSGN